MSIITLNSVSKSFFGRHVIRDAYLEVNAGQSLALTGANGAGKSVLFKLISRLMSPSSGSVVIDSKYLSKGGVFPIEFGILIDRPSFMENETGLTNLLSLARIRNIIDEKQVKSTMSSLGLDPGLRQSVGKYSLGMKQKLALAQAMMEDQKLLLLDEPFNGLDTESVEHIHEVLNQKLNDGKTLIFTSHQQNDIERLAKRIVRIENQTLVEDCLGNS